MFPPNRRAASRLIAALIVAAGCSSSSSTEAVDASVVDAPDTAPADTSSGESDATAPPLDGKYHYHFVRGAPGTLVVPHPSSPLYGFRLTLLGDELDVPFLDVTVSAGEAVGTGSGPTVILEPHGTRFKRPATIELPVPALAEAATSDEERLVVVRRQPEPGAQEELVTGALALAHHTISGWRQLGPLALRPGPSPVNAAVSRLVENGKGGQYPNRIISKTLGFSSVRAEVATRLHLTVSGVHHAGIACTTAADCFDGMPCSTETCEPVEGGLSECRWAWSLPGAPCDDGDAATTGDRCMKYVCAGVDAECQTDADCDLGSPCTGEQCAAGKCASTPDGAGGLCDDADPASALAACVAGECAAFTPTCTVDADCDDHNPCTREACVNKACAVEAVGSTPCDDGDIGTTGDRCSFGVCVGTHIACAEEGAACDDGDANTTGDVCKSSMCIGKSTTATCTCAQATLTAPGCSWPDATKCSGLTSAVCYEECGGWGDTPCIKACDASMASPPERQFDDGASYTAEECTVTVHCP